MSFGVRCIWRCYDKTSEKQINESILINLGLLATGPPTQATGPPRSDAGVGVGMLWGTVIPLFENKKLFKLAFHLFHYPIYSVHFLYFVKFYFYPRTIFSRISVHVFPKLFDILDAHIYKNNMFIKCFHSFLYCLKNFGNR